MNNIIKIASYLLVLIAIFTLLPLNPFIRWLVWGFLVCFCFLIQGKYHIPLFRTDKFLMFIYLVWLVVCLIRGCFIADNYWDWKNLVVNTLCLLLPVFIIPFSIPRFPQYCLRQLMRYVLPIFLVWGLWVINRGRYQFNLGFVYILAFFIPFAPKRWKVVVGGFTLLLLVAMLGARSQSLKAVVSILMCLAFYFSRYISTKIIKIVHLGLYIVPIVLLFLGISGKFNVLEDLSDNDGKYVESRVVDGKMEEEDLSADTRTFIYVEVLNSALDNNYVWAGRTPARGNDSMAFGAQMAEQLQVGRYERNKNELCHLNIFTWLGLVGMILYGLFYVRSSFLAVYKSKNNYIKLIGLFVAFHWAFGWLEDTNDFDILNISLWITIAMGLSETFRNMSDAEFRNWVRHIFKVKKN